MWPAPPPPVPDIETPLIAVDAEGRLDAWNAAAAAHLAAVGDELTGRPLHELAVDGDELAALFALTTNGRRAQAEINLRSDVLVETISEVTIDPVMAGGRRVGALVSIRSLPRRYTPGTLTPRDATGDAADVAARVFDARPLRIALYDRLRLDLDAAHAAGCRLGLIVIDLGAVVRDASPPREPGGWLTSVLRDGDSVTNVGGDEFVICIGGDPDAATLDSVAARLRRRVAETLGSAPVRTAIALFPRDGAAAPQLITAAYRRLAL